LITLILILFLFSIGSTRPQMHQWWVLQIFGLYGTLYALSRLVKIITSIVFAKKSSIRSKNEVNLYKRLYFNTKAKISKKTLFQLLALLLISAVGPGVVFSILNNASESLETNRLKELATRYASQDWQLTTLNKESKKFDLDKESRLIKIEMSGSCNLTGVKIHYLGSDFLGLETGDFYRTKFHIANTNSKIAYIPFFPIGIARSTISIGGLNSSCSLRVYQSNLKEQSLPLVALLVPNEENNKSQLFTDENKTNLAGTELLSSPFSFEGYVNNGGYQAVGDEFEHEWPKNQIGDRILGRSKQGYQEIDIWWQEIDLKNDGLRVRVRGEISGGVLAIGWAESKPSSPNALPTEFDYSIRGSIFDRSTRVLDECFELEGLERKNDQLNVELFIGAVLDLYSPSWTSLKINSVTVDQGTCDPNLQPTNFLPTL
jgi:hypothetical protein